MRYRIRSALFAITAAMLLGSGGAQAVAAPTTTSPKSGDTAYLTGSGMDATATGFVLAWMPITDAIWYRVWLNQGSSGPNMFPCARYPRAVDGEGCWFKATDVTTGGAVRIPIEYPFSVGAYTLYVGAWNNGTVWSAAIPFTLADRFEDRSKTVFDHQTNLEWEKKTEDDSIHAWSTSYTWSTGTNNPDGTAFTVFLAGLNAGACSSTSDGTTESNQTDCSFAGHGDWRLPKLSELKTIRDCSHGALCVDPIFGPTRPGGYWSSSNGASSPSIAWFVYFMNVNFGTATKANNYSVRAVRGGSD